MKQIIPNYTFVASTRVITFTDFAAVRLDRVLVVANATRGQLVYTLDGSLGAATVSTNTLMVPVAAASAANGDKLIIIYDTLAGDPTYDVPAPNSIDKHISTADTLVANTVPNSGNGRTLTASGFTGMEVEISNINGAAAVYITLDGTTPTSSNFIAVLPATPCSVALPYGGNPTVKVVSAGTPIVGYTLRGH